jgi:hypothetical protein
LLSSAADDTFCLILAAVSAGVDKDKRCPNSKTRSQPAGGKVEYLYDPQRGIATQISGTGFRAIYQVALSIDGKHLLAKVPAGESGLFRFASIIRSCLCAIRSARHVGPKLSDV